MTEPLGQPRRGLLADTGRPTLPPNPRQFSAVVRLAAYSAFSVYFAKSFFPNGSATEQLLNTAAIFAVGFLMHPIDGWLFGLYADKHGRKAALLPSARCAAAC